MLNKENKDLPSGKMIRKVLEWDEIKAEERTSMAKVLKANKQKLLAKLSCLSVLLHLMNKKYEP